jgi:mono/diheme cytochrome c family protein
MRRVSTGMLIVMYLSLCGAALQSSASSPKPSAQSAADGQRIFVQSCAACHDAHGTSPKNGPGLKNYYRDHQPHPSDIAVRTVIQQGKGKMPGFSSLSKSQTDDLVAYLKTL